MYDFGVEIMEVKKTYYKYLDIIRVVSCIAVLLYHLNILKGGFLAVCSFFVLSGYLSCISAFKKEKFSILEYYKNRLLKIYVPLLIVVFISIFVISFFDNIIWLNLKPETTSVLLGYNNFWQLSVNADYFAHHINSPFMHLWYVSILLQFELVFPLLFLLLKKIGDKINKSLPLILLIILSASSIIFFYTTNGIMNAYYNTFARSFSLIFGLTLGFIHIYFKNLIPKKFSQKTFNNIMFLTYLILLIISFFIIDDSSKYFTTSMIISSIITLRLIDYGTIISKENLSIIDKFIKSLSSISYEIYLAQYPVIFLFQYINIQNNYKILMIIPIILILSYIIHFALHNFKKLKILKISLCIIVGIISSFGVYKYIIEKDHTSEMKALEEQLLQNEIAMQKKQEDFMSSFKQENDDYNKLLSELEDDEKGLANVVSNLPVIGIGDSVMLGATTELYKQFPKGYFDAKVSRTAWLVNGILKDLKNRNMFGNPIILNLGANGDCSEECKIEIMKTCQGKEVFWVNVTNDIDVNVNSKLENLSKKYSNLHIVDWNSISKGHPEYFVSDGIHLTSSGRVAYTNAIYDSIYNFYLKEYTDKKQELVDKHNQELKTKISFYGNDILLNAFENIKGEFENANFVIDKNFTFESLKEQIEKYIKEDSLTYKIVFAFDNNVISKNEYQELLDLCKNNKIYIVSVNEDLSSLNSDNVKVIDFFNEVNKYLMADKRHLNNDGNIRLSYLLKENID